MNAEEKTFLTQGNVLVTSARLVIGAETYAMGTINSVKVSHVDHVPSKLVPSLLGFLMIAIGGAICVSEQSILAGIVAALGVWLVVIAFKLKKSTTFTLVLRNSSGESPALVSKNGSEINAVHQAVTNAMVFRG
jgi:outer membrane lipoprotein SlyB